MISNNKGCLKDTVIFVYLILNNYLNLLAHNCMQVTNIPKICLVKTVVTISVISIERTQN